MDTYLVIISATSDISLIAARHYRLATITIVAITI